MPPLVLERDSNRKEDKRSYSEVVKNSPIPRVNKVDPIKVGSALVRESSMWLSNNLLGELRWEGAIPELYDLCEACGLLNVKIAKWGGNQVLISFCNLEEAQAIIHDFKLKFLNIFGSLELWKPGLYKPSRLIWVRCFGVPLHDWNEKDFLAIGEKFGEVLGVDEETSNRSFLEFGRVCLKVFGHKIFFFYDIWFDVFGNKFLVKVKEETHFDGCPAPCNLRLGGLQPHNRFDVPVSPRSKIVSDGSSVGEEGLSNKGEEFVSQSSNEDSKMISIGVKSQSDNSTRHADCRHDDRG